MVPPDYVSINDLSIHGLEGFIVWQGKQCLPTIFCMEWPEWDKCRKSGHPHKIELGNVGSIALLADHGGGMLFLTRVAQGHL